MNISDNKFLDYVSYLAHAHSEDHPNLKPWSESCTMNETSGEMVPVNCSALQKTSENMMSKLLPIDVEGIVLSYAADHPSRNRVISGVFHSKVVNQNAVAQLKEMGLYGVLDRLKIVVSGISAEKYLYQCYFDAVSSVTTYDEKEWIVSLSVPQTKRTQHVLNRLQKGCEKIFSCLSSFFGNSMVQSGICFFLAFTAGWYHEQLLNYCCLKIFQVTAPLFTGLIPVHPKTYLKALAVTVLTLPITWGLRGYTPLRQVYRGINACGIVMIKLFTDRDWLAERICNLVLSGSKVSSRIMGYSAHQLKERRLRNGLDQARKLWVDGMTQPIGLFSEESSQTLPNSPVFSAPYSNC
jgi:hypothetical protein